MALLLLSGELGQELWGDTGGVGGIWGRSAGVSCITWASGTIGALGEELFSAKLNGFSCCTSAEGGGEGSLACGAGLSITPTVKSPIPQMLSSSAAASLRMWGGMSNRLLSGAGSSSGAAFSCGKEEKEKACYSMHTRGVSWI